MDSKRSSVRKQVSNCPGLISSVVQFAPLAAFRLFHSENPRGGTPLRAVTANCSPTCPTVIGDARIDRVNGSALNPCRLLNQAVRFTVKTLTTKSPDNGPAC